MDVHFPLNRAAHNGRYGRRCYSLASSRESSEETVEEFLSDSKLLRDRRQGCGSVRKGVAAEVPRMNKDKVMRLLCYHSMCWLIWWCGARGWGPRSQRYTVTSCCGLRETRKIGHLTRIRSLYGSALLGLLKFSGICVSLKHA